MKIKKFKSSNNLGKFIQLKTFKLYSKIKQSNSQKILQQIHLIKACNIIYQYYLQNKKILLLGFPNNFRNIFKKTDHKLITESLFYHGILTNKESINHIIKIKNIDLIIINSSKNDLTVEKESYTKRIPTIIFKNKQKFTHTIAYSWFSYYKSLNEKKINNNFFLFFLKNTLIKAKQNHYKNKGSILNPGFPMLFKKK